MPPFSEGGAAKGLRVGGPDYSSWDRDVALGTKGGYLRMRDSGRDIPMAVKGGTEANRGITTRRYTLTPD